MVGLAADPDELDRTCRRRRFVAQMLDQARAQRPDARAQVVGERAGATAETQQVPFHP